MANKTLAYFRIFIKNSSFLSGKVKAVILKRLQKTTLTEIGKKFGLTEGRIRQIEKLALAKIKSKTRQLTLFTTN